MFGVNKEELVKGLCLLSCTLCGYMGNRCDCKYMQNSDTLDRGSEATGCPETAMAATLINAMTAQEFHAIAQRAGIQLNLPDDAFIQIGEFMSKLKGQKEAQLIRIKPLKGPHVPKKAITK
jgi:hypothetical protein